MFSTSPSVGSLGRAAASVAAAGSPYPEVENPTLNRLLQIFQKVKSGVELDDAEKTFVSDSSRYTASPYERFSAWVSTPADATSVSEINALAGRILDRSIPSRDLLGQVQSKLLSCGNPSAREAASLAKLIAACLTREASFTEALDDFRMQLGKTPTRGNLIDFVAQYNREILPKISNAGMVICRVPALDWSNEIEYEVRYDTAGYLEIIDGPVGPLDFSCRQELTAEQRREMVTLYNSLAENAYYNNLGETLEFINYYTTKKATDPELTLERALESYTPDLAGMFDKYQSGTCILLSAKFRQELAKAGIQSESVAKETLNTWTGLPIPGTEGGPVKWMSLSAHLKGADHTYTTCVFRDEDGHEGLMKFEGSFEKERKEEISEHLARGKTSGVQRYFNDTGIGSSEDYPNKVVDLEYIGKSRLRGRLKAVIMKDNMALGIDFMRGNFYINQSWAKTMTGLPLNAAGMVSIEIEDLAKPDEMGVYFIDAVPTEMTHRDALRMVLDKARPHMILPPGTEENLIALAQNSKELFEGFFAEPLPLIKTHYRDLLAIHKMMKEVKTTFGEYSQEYNNLGMEFSDVIDPLFLGPDPDAARARIGAFKEKLQAMCAQSAASRSQTTV